MHLFSRLKTHCGEAIDFIQKLGLGPTKRFSSEVERGHDDARDVGGVRARDARIATTLCWILALVRSTAVASLEPIDPLVAKVQDSLRTHASGDVEAALAKYDALVGDGDAFDRLSNNAKGTVLTNHGILYTRGGANRALPYFERAVSIDPGHAETLVNLVVCLTEDFGKHDEALVFAREAVRLRPNHAKSHHVLGNALQSVGQMPEAYLRLKTAEALAEGTRAKPKIGWYKRWGPGSLGVGRNSGVFVNLPSRATEDTEDDASDPKDAEDPGSGGSKTSGAEIGTYTETVP